MAERQDLLVGVYENVAGSNATAATNTATQAAPGAGLQLYITGFSVSVTNTAPAAATTYTCSIRQNGGATTRFQFVVPAAFFSPIIYEFKRPIKVPENQDCDIQLSNLGGGTVTRVELYTITRPVTGGVL